MCHSVVVEFGFVNRRILWMNFKFSWVLVCVFVVYDPSDAVEEEKERF